MGDIREGGRPGELYLLWLGERRRGQGAARARRWRASACARGVGTWRRAGGVCDCAVARSTEHGRTGTLPFIGRACCDDENTGCVVWMESLLI